MSQNKQIEYLEERINELAKDLENINRSQGRMIKQLVKYQSRLQKYRRKNNRRSENKNDKCNQVSENVKDPCLVQGYFERPYTSKFVPKIGHHVRILKTNPGRDERGTIVGFCKDGKVKIDTNENLPPIIRSTKNILNSNEGVSSSNTTKSRNSLVTFRPM